MLFMQPDDIMTLTGRKLSRMQCRWLSEHDFKFMIGADGKPKVLISEIDFHMGRGTTEKPQQSARPDFSKV